MLRTKFLLCLTSFNVPHTCQVSFRERSVKANKMKRLMKEFKLVFGELVETKAQKKKRMKLEKKGKIFQREKSTKNTELSWILQNSQKNLKNIVISTKPQAPGKRQIAKSKQDSSSSEKNETARDIGANIFNPTCNLSTKVTSKNINNNHNAVFTTETSSLTQNLFKGNSNICNDDASLVNSNVFNTKNTSVKHNNYERLSDIIIKNLPTFPIMSNKQKSIAQSTEILSLSRLDDPKTIRFPSISKILTQTMPVESKLALEAWKQKMIKKLGQEGFEMHQKALLEDGASLHSCIAQNLLGKEFEIPSRIDLVFKSVQSVLKDIRNVKAIETYVAHKKLQYKGVIDCVASYRGENYVIDWKKSDKMKLNLKETYDGPVQVAAYIGAINASNLYPFVIKRGLLVIAYTCGAPATVYEICDNTLQHYWTVWLHRLQKYYVEMANNENTRQ